jgi:membrane peptidoglycan carboxypeptidase
MKGGQTQILTEQTNFIVIDMLRDVLRPGGTGYRAATNYEFDKPAAGKTGTTQNWKDAWFTGFTPELAASVWVGFDRNSVSLGRGQAGGVVAAPIWAQFMRDALQDKPSDWFPRPQGVYAITIDRNTGLLPTKDCKDIMTEYFLEGTIPTEYSTQCGEEEGSNESFNIDIFNRKDDSSRFFESPRPEDSSFSESYDMDFDMGRGEHVQPPALDVDSDKADFDDFIDETETTAGDDYSKEGEAVILDNVSEEGETPTADGNVEEVEADQETEDYDILPDPDTVERESNLE